MNGERVELDAVQLANMVKMARANHGDVCAAQWIVEEMRKQPTPFLDCFELRRATCRTCIRPARGTDSGQRGTQ